MSAKARGRWMFVVGLGVAVVGVLALMLFPGQIPVDRGVAIRGPIDEAVSDLGQAKVREAYVVAAPVTGRLERTPLKVGDWITAGASVVARIRPAASSLLDPSLRAQREAAVTAARADRDRLAAEVGRTAALLARTRPLVEEGIASRQSLDDAKAGADAAQRAVADATAQLRAAEAALIGPDAVGAGEVVVKAPSSGFVTKVLEPSERTVTFGTPLIEVSDHATLEAAIEFLSQDAVRIREGMAAEVYDWGGPGVIPARVRRVEPEGFTKTSALGVEEQRALVLLQFTSPPERWRRLAAGYRVWGRVFLRRENAALKVPVGTLVRANGAWAVYRIEAGRARLRRVEVGAVTDREAEIVKGLAAGDPIIVYPSDQVTDGVRVKQRR
jgi:HlyD family secretion protein